MIITHSDVLKVLPLERFHNMEEKEQRSTRLTSSKHALLTEWAPSDSKYSNSVTVVHVNDGQCETSTFRIEKRRKK